MILLERKSDLPEFHCQPSLYAELSPLLESPLLEASRLRCLFRMASLAAAGLNICDGLGVCPDP